MKVTVLMSDAWHPVVPVIEDWAGEMGACGFDVTILYDKAQLSGGDILFLISFGEILDARRSLAEWRSLESRRIFSHLIKPFTT